MFPVLDNEGPLKGIPPIHCIREDTQLRRSRHMPRDEQKGYLEFMGLSGHTQGTSLERHKSTLTSLLGAAPSSCTVTGSIIVGCMEKQWQLRARCLEQGKQHRRLWYRIRCVSSLLCWVSTDCGTLQSLHPDSVFWGDMFWSWRRSDHTNNKPEVVNSLSQHHMSWVSLQICPAGMYCQCRHCLQDCCFHHLNSVLVFCLPTDISHAVFSLFSFFPPPLLHSPPFPSPSTVPLLLLVCFECFIRSDSATFTM